MIRWHDILPKLGYWQKPCNKSLIWKGGQYVQTHPWHKDFNAVSYQGERYKVCEQTGLLIGTIELTNNPFNVAVTVLHSEN